MNLKTSLLLSLLFLISLSKEILVFNEEILVLFSFGIFIFLVYNFGSTMISSELDSRAVKIQEEFNYYKNMQEKTLSHLVSYHKKQKLLSEEIKTIFVVIKKDISLIILTYSQLFIKSLNNAIEDKLKKIIASQSKFDSLLQIKISNELYMFLISKYSSSKDKKISQMFLTNSINKLITIK
uniref:ATP synthase F0 subunit 4 n=1 Tax=Cryptomonas pyrenoidifera TaxID=233184 RepID=UPI00226CA3C0|nr:ATP synthase F0 subunit 4 [Cryptomonas pyrenoidifera]UZP15119.1 ATP synthase F0 subunit 4 [Cryptomonas pyrenoidifera]